MRPMQVDYELDRPLRWQGAGQLWAGRRRDGVVVLVRRFPRGGEGSPPGLDAELAALELFDRAPVARVEAVVADTDGTTAVVLAPPIGASWHLDGAGDAPAATDATDAIGAGVGSFHRRVAAAGAVVEVVAVLGAAGVAPGRFEADALRRVRRPDGALAPVVVDLGQVVVPTADRPSTAHVDLVALVRHVLGPTAHATLARLEATSTTSELAAVLHELASSGSVAPDAVDAADAADAGSDRGSPSPAPTGEPYLPPVGVPSVAGRVRHRRAVLAGVAASVVVGSVVAGVGAIRPTAASAACTSGSPRSEPRGPVSTATPHGGVLQGDVDADGCVDTVVWHAEGTVGVVVRVVDGRGRPAVESTIGFPGEVLLGDWDCDGAATLAVHRPDSGEVVVFDGWVGRDAPERPVTSTTVLPVGAGAVVVERGGCDVIRPEP